MQRFLSLAAAVLAPILGLAASAAPARAQKALVYCPIGIDADGCGTIVRALTSAFPDGVDSAYDSQAPVDLATADLNHYAVLVIPSLADNATAKPYGLLRDAQIAARLKTVLTGHVAVWSGAPDEGSI